MGSSLRQFPRSYLSSDESDQNSSTFSRASIEDYAPELHYNEQTSTMRKQHTAIEAVGPHSGPLLLRTRTRSSKEKVFNQSETLMKAVKEEPAVPKWKSVLEDMYPRWFISNVRSWEKFKVVFRTWVAKWVSLVFILINPVHIWLQAASFLAMIVNMVNPAGDLSISEAVTTCLCIFLGSVVGWFHSVVAMAIAMRVRKIKIGSEKDYINHLIENGICEYDPKTIKNCVQNDIFYGNYLEAKSTVIFAIATGFVVILFFLIRMKNPLRTPLCISSTITGIISCTYCNLFPYFGGIIMLYNILLKPFGVGLAIIIITSIFIFPETSSYKFLNYSTKQMHLLQKYSIDHIKMMNEVNPSHEIFGDFTRLHKIMTSFRELFFPVSIQANIITKEFYYMRLSPTDILKLNDCILKLGDTLTGIEYFYMNLQECKKWIDYGTSGINDLERVVTNTETNPVANYERSKTIEAYRKYFNEVMDNTSNIRNVEDLDYIMQVIRMVFLESFETAHGLIEKCTEWLELTNNFRLTRFWPSKKKKYLEKIKELNESITEGNKLLFIQSKNIIQTIENACISKGKEDIILPIIGQVSLFEYIAKEYIEAVDDLCKNIVQWNKIQPKPRIYYPFVYYIYTWKSKLKKEPELENEVIKRRNPDAIPVNNLLGKVLNKSVRAYNYIMKDTHVPLGFRTAIITILTTFLAYFPSSVYWFYGHSLVWVPVMVSISVSSDSYDSVY